MKTAGPGAGRPNVLAGALPVCLVCALAGPTLAAATKTPEQPLYLVARRGLLDPYFRHSVVLMLPLDAVPIPVVVGIIINRPTPLMLRTLFPFNVRLKPSAAVAYFGGPVDIRDVSIFYRSNHPPDHAIPIGPGVYASFDAAGVDKLLAEKPQDASRRVFLGRAQWSSEQLRGEMLRGSWYSIRAAGSLIFSKQDSDQVWQSLLDRARPGMLAIKVSANNRPETIRSDQRSANP